MRRTTRFCLALTFACLAAFLAGLLLDAWSIGWRLLPAMASISLLAGFFFVRRRLSFVRLRNRIGGTFPPIDYLFFFLTTSALALVSQHAGTLTVLRATTFYAPMALYCLVAFLHDALQPATPATAPATVE